MLFPTDIMFRWFFYLALAFAARLQHYAQVLILTILAAGPIPAHVALIMDGNRRFARGRNLAVVRGHVEGFQALRRVRAFVLINTMSLIITTCKIKYHQYKKNPP